MSAFLSRLIHHWTGSILSGGNSNRKRSQAFRLFAGLLLFLCCGRWFDWIVLEGLGFLLLGPDIPAKASENSNRGRRVCSVKRSMVWKSVPFIRSDSPTSRSLLGDHNGLLAIWCIRCEVSKRNPSLPSLHSLPSKQPNKQTKGKDRQRNQRPSPPNTSIPCREGPSRMPQGGARNPQGNPPNVLGRVKGALRFEEDDVKRLL